MWAAYTQTETLALPGAPMLQHVTLSSFLCEKR
jgi:hypothetical protein